ncbi:MAG TPA: DUF3761 domain-containing protein [Gemmatimonadaceae bacterium]|nr:DUF3761 domain-containing protein [Gemmatimonadaceae bacterium]
MVKNLLKTGSVLAMFAVAALAVPTVSGAQPASRTVTCKDNTTSKAGRGACSGHGGVAEAAATKGAPTKAPPAKAEPMKAAPMKTADVPAKGGADAKTVTCTDGSSSKSGRGACSGHGGIATGAPAKAATPPVTPPAPAKTAPPMATKAEGKPTAKCKDGTLSYAKNHSGACSSHGGVAEWLDGTKKTP